MNAEQEQFDQQLARLVDGELSGDAYRAAIAALDEQPHGWRRCALAFLEAQALGRELAVLRDEQLEPPAKLPAVSPQRLRNNSVLTQLGIVTAAVAASFLIALPLGGYLNDKFLHDAPPVVTNPSEREVAPSAVAQRPSPNSPQQAARQPLGKLPLMVDGDRPVDLPVYHVDNAGDWLSNQDAASLSPEMLETIRRAGHRVVHEQSVMPITLDDGGRVLVPIDRYRITPVSRTIQ